MDRVLNIVTYTNSALIPQGNDYFFNDDNMSVIAFASYTDFGWKEISIADNSVIESTPKFKPEDRLRGFRDSDGRVIIVGRRQANEYEPAIVIRVF